MCLFSGQNIDESLVICNTSTSEEFEEFVVAVTWLYNVDNVFSLSPRDTSDISKLSDKLMVRVDEIQQLNMIGSQRLHQSFVYRTSVSDICIPIYTSKNLFENLFDLGQV